MNVAVFFKLNASFPVTFKENESVAKENESVAKENKSVPTNGTIVAAS
jgi:hypothetical protein